MQQWRDPLIPINGGEIDLYKKGRIGAHSEKNRHDAARREIIAQDAATFPFAQDLDQPRDHGWCLRHRAGSLSRKAAKRV